MVERLKAAVEKARRDRLAAGHAVATPRPSPQPTPPSGDAPPSSWLALPELTFDAQKLGHNRVVSFARDDPSHFVFDVLRTRLLTACIAEGWTSIGVTSPDRACGKTTVVANLVFSLARQPTSRTVALDLDMRQPALAKRLGVGRDRRLADMLTGKVAPSERLERWGDRLALALNDRAERDSAEVLLAPGASAALAALRAEYAPTIMLVDLPPMLAGDDALAAMSHLDAVLLVAAAGATRATQIEACEHLIPEGVAFAGLVLNKCDSGTLENSGYGYGQGAN